MNRTQNVLAVLAPSQSDKGIFVLPGCEIIPERGQFRLWSQLAGMGAGAGLRCSHPVQGPVMEQPVPQLPLLSFGSECLLLLLFLTLPWVGWGGV